MNNHIAQIDKFNSDTIDHDIIVPNKTYFNIYNNSLDEPFHKFWFFIENAKLINIYDEHTVFRFALNNKSDKNKKLIEYLKNLFNHIKKLFLKIYPEIVVNIPWKEYENYPYLINFGASNNTICIDPSQNSKNIKEINKDQTYSILFELTYIQVSTIISEGKTNYSLKFKFNLIMIQEKLLDMKTSLLENINQINNPKPQTNYVAMQQHSNALTSVLGELTETGIKSLKNVSSVPTKQPMMRFALNANDLLNKKNALNKIGAREIKEIDDEKNIPQYLEQKNKLKKVETDERSLITILKREFDEIASHNNELHNIKEIDLNKNLSNTENKLINSTETVNYNKEESISLHEKNDKVNELNKITKLDELDELDELDLLNKNIPIFNIGKPTNNSKICQIQKKKLEMDSETELEAELEAGLKAELKAVIKAPNSNKSKINTLGKNTIIKPKTITTINKSKTTKNLMKKLESDKINKSEKIDNYDLDMEFENISKK